MTSPQESVTEALARGDMVGIDSGDYALMVLVRRDGEADVIPTIPTSPERVARTLREVAERLDAL